MLHNISIISSPGSRSSSEMETFSSSSESEEESQDAVVKALSDYCFELSGQEVMSSTDLLQVSLRSSSCLICLSRIKRLQAVWSCSLCYTYFHLVCIQHWAKDGIKPTNATLSDCLFPGVHLVWTCPKCRVDYNQADTPSLYKCFCGKKVDPPPDPWLLAHSCGEICGRDLKSKCGHKCLSLCHPGPCPPCPKTVLFSCYCEKSPVKSQRCGLTGWSCGEVCRHVLTCGFHTCEQQCHKGPCDPCSEKALQTCICCKQVDKMPCGQSQWSCGQACGKLLKCQHHLCQRICHSGGCGDCPRNGSQFCPCGEKKYVLECTSDVPCCGDTCSQELNCGMHQCVRKCHFGGCGPCLQVADKFCRCGQKKKSLPCHQEYLCDSRCQNIKQCGRHQCRRKCCDGNCTPCQRVCGRSLLCKAHKCPAPCHSGRCYPCILSVSVTCACGKTVIDVPCGRERATKPPRCIQPCQTIPSCHHLDSMPHQCHFGECPPCRQVCAMRLTCSHICVALCHSQPVRPRQVTAPWTKVKPLLLVKQCPPCKQLVPKSCYGGHQIHKFPCSEVVDYSCGRLCGCILKCGNHTCKRICHSVIHLDSPTRATQLEAGLDCFTCEQLCSKPQHPECQHHCPLPCHSGECPPCEIILKFFCHCSCMDIYIKCSDWCTADSEIKDCRRTCNSQCSRTLSCGHRCPKSCHPGPCTPSNDCQRKVTIRCPCHRLKKECRCNEPKKLICNEECFLAIQRKEMAAGKTAAEAVALKEGEEKEAIAYLERQLRPRKRKQKLAKIADKPQNSSLLKNKTTGFTFVVLCMIIILFLYFYMI